MTSTESMPNIRNPAPHRGFNAKAREVLLDPEPPMRFGLDRTGSDDEFRRKLNGLRLMRTDSEATNGSQKSHSSTQSYSVGQVANEFDELNDLPRSAKPRNHKLIGDIGKTKSTGDLFKKKTIIHTFKQQNIMKLPSVESDIGGGGSLPRSNSSSSIVDGFSDRQSQYALK